MKRPVAAGPQGNRATGRDLRDRDNYLTMSVPTMPAALWPGMLQ